MYQQNTTTRPARHFSNFSQRPLSFSFRSCSRGGFSRPSRFYGPCRGAPRRCFGSIINPSLFIKKAEEFTKIIETNPSHSFTDFNFNPQLLANIKAMGYQKPTPIQDQSIAETCLVVTFWALPTLVLAKLLLLPSLLLIK